MTMSPIAMAKRNKSRFSYSKELDVSLTDGNAIKLDRVERRLHPRHKFANEHTDDHGYEDKRRQQSVKDTQPLKQD
jgi:hypothetical protein